MQATIKMDTSEMSYAVFRKLKSLFKGMELEIKINTDNFKEKNMEHGQKLMKMPNDYLTT